MARGYIYTLEVLIAVTIIFLSLFLAFRDPPPGPEFETALIKINTLDAIDYLEQSGILREMIFKNNETGLKEALANLTPDTIGFNLSICSADCQASVPDNRKTVVIDHYISGLRDTHGVKKVRIWAWGLE